MTGIPTRRLGRTGLQVSELGLGGYQYTREFGVPKREALAILAEALSSDITYFDTAPMYGAGESEELIGRAIPSATPGVVISSKVGHFDRTIAHHLGKDAYRNDDAIRRVVAHSLHLLRRDHLDVLMIHEPEWPEWGIDRFTGDSPVMAGCEALKRNGIVGAIGLGGEDAVFMADLVETGRVDVVLSVMHYDLVTQDIRDQLLPSAARHDVGVVLGTPLRQGLLATAHPEPRAAMVADAERPEDQQEELAGRLRRIYALAAKVGIELPELAIRYLLSDRRVSSVIPGSRTVREVRSNVASAGKGPLPRDLLDAIEEIGTSRPASS